MIKKITWCTPFWGYGIVLAIQSITGSPVSFNLVAPILLFFALVSVAALVRKVVTPVEFGYLALLPPVLIAATGEIIASLLNR
ncbi:MAG: hypothetical protein AAF591_09525 [Verrucomicrobiota bacterium]